MPVDELPSLEERRDIYAAWRSKLNRRAEENRAAVIEPGDERQAVTDQWSPDALFVDSRRLEAESA